VLFPRREQNKSLWGSLRSSLSPLGDFADHQVRPAVRHFSLLPLSTDDPRRPAWQRADDAVMDCPASIGFASVPVLERRRGGGRQAKSHRTPADGEPVNIVAR